ncbi:hypothetical protein [Brevibacillus laterosporus]|uniref:Uncharacterized protein n=1 Tax=Brevibacillus laterosporus TaxID=1465 RepID=A0AAP3DL05_BRELA|nr:hypothetical protein [Brevibacillus laterosporus]MCR8982867.1 hypothetical protein [Brevibacillus laterosporus]MCZ0810023.1 hypothetical protein [Brevibacillus laterosporus]MCZ0828665.1 hypothetical protein [Brevibacillus laterosporus]MCZ0852708.1 hypothetical protein [Brevibacillus laterosporus]
MAEIESLSGDSLSLRDLSDAIFRTNPNYKLIPFDHLPQEEKKALADLLKDPNFYGILRSHNQDLGMKSVCRETALLFFTLLKAGKLPRYVQIMYGSRFNEVVAMLVLDRILEIESNERFLSGSEAYQVIYEDQPKIKPNGAISRLSIEALKYGQSLEFDDCLKMSSRLYSYNHLPVTTHWKHLFSSEEAITQYLGIGFGGKNRAILDHHWASINTSSNKNWLSWSSRDAVPIRSSYKLYISPHCEHLLDVFSATLEVLTEVRAPSFKIGKDVYGLLRPDKMVAYFTTYDEMSETAVRLVKRLKGISAHGVPFTAAIEPSGLLSWGMDPPRQDHFLPWQGPSWRRWITDRLAVALISAKTSSRTIEPWQFALDRLALEGVDTSSWVPKPTIWNELERGE